jgi:hypothetical protein
MAATNVNFSIAAIFILAALLVLVVTNYIFQRRQAKELHRMADAAEEGLMLEIAIQREAKAKEVLVEDPLEWLQGEVARGVGLAVELQGPRQAYPDLRTVDIQAARMRLVVSVHDKTELGKLLKGEKARGKAARALAKFDEPLLGKKPRRATVFERNLMQDRWFDLKAAQAGQELGVDWTGQTRLYFYLVSIS